MKSLLLCALLITAAPLVHVTGAQTAGEAGEKAYPVALTAQEVPGPPPATSRPQIIEETELDRQTRAVASQLRCVVCQGLSVDDSPSQLAQEMRALVREQLEAGMTPAEVKQFFVDKYGEWVLLEPRASGFNLVVYVLPVLMLIAGAAFVFVTARRMVRPAGAVASGESAEAAARDEAGHEAPYP
jgi:cytochrome c-type biogenesis protein CcmH